MKIRAHGNSLAIALAAVAVVFAASGTAYAVTATVVNIADPSSPSRVAKVDAAGRLNTVDATSTISIATTGFPSAGNSGDVFSAPTTATLAVSKFSVTALTTLSGSWSVFFYQVPVVADGTCSLTTAVRSLGFGSVAAGATGGQDYTAPLIVTPLGGAAYCLDVYFRLNSGSPTGNENFGVQITAYAAGGRYTGAGAPEATTGAPRSKADMISGH